MNILDELNVLDLCTGSGCVAIAIAKNCPQAHVMATDSSPAALAVAQENAAKHNVTNRMEFCVGDLFAAVPEEMKFDVITANPPYVTTTEMETLAQDIRKFEPRQALDGGADGLDVVRRIVEAAPKHLEPGGELFVEISPEQGTVVESLLTESGRYQDVRLIKDLTGRPRVAAGRLASRP